MKPSIVKDSRLPWDRNNALIFWGVVGLQVLLVLIMYWYVLTLSALQVILKFYVLAYQRHEPRTSSLANITTHTILNYIST